VLSLPQLPLLLVCIALALHLLGERRAAVKLRRPRSREARWRTASFYAGLAIVIVALEGPVDDNSSTLLWVHMLQHVLLLSIAAPLIALGAPWMSIWRPLPLGLRRAVARAVARSPALAPLRWLGRSLGSPWPALVVCSANLVIWHIPAVYDFALRHEGVHMLEHVTFIAFGVLLWIQMFESPPMRARLALSVRVYYVLAFDVVCWLLSLVLAFASHPLYPAYAHLAHRPGGLSALADQQIAGGVMLGLGSLAATLYVFYGLYRWLGAPRDARHPTPEPPTPTTRRTLTVGSMSVAASLFLVACGSSSTSSRSADAIHPGLQGLILKPPKPAPSLSLRNYTGKMVNLASFRGRAVLVTFLYTHCPNWCPLIAANLAAAQRQLGAGARRVKIIAVTVDPKRDTPGAVRAFLSARDAAGRMDYLLGTRMQLAPVWKAWDVGVVIDKNKLTTGHSDIVYGVTAAGRMAVVYPPDFTPAQIVHDVPLLAGG